MNNRVNFEKEEQRVGEWGLALPQSHSNKNSTSLIKEQIDQ